MTSEQITGFIIKYKVSTALISSTLGINKSNIANRKSKVRKEKFTDKQIVALQKIFEDMWEEWKGISRR